MTKNAQENGASQAEVRTAFTEILGLKEELASERGTYMQRCQTIHEQIAEVYDGAKQKGITKKVLKGIVKEHELRARAEACRAELEADEQHEYDQLCEKLGDLADLPLGRAALGAKGDGAATLASLGA